MVSLFASIIAPLEFVKMVYLTEHTQQRNMCFFLRILFLFFSAVVERPTPAKNITLFKISAIKT